MIRSTRRLALVILAVGVSFGSLLAANAGGAPGDATATQIADLNPGSDGSHPFEMIDINGVAYFAANDGTNGRELWKSDGTPGGTTMVEDAIPGGGINPGPASANLGRFTNVNGTLFFRANDGVNGSELWQSDGTPAGTKMVDDDAVADGGITPGLASSNPDSLAVVGDTLFFEANDGTNGEEAWMTDGTAAGTRMVDDDAPADGGINPGADDSLPSDFVDLNGTAYFRAEDGVNGLELWRSDGTAAGTTMVDDLLPGVGINPGSAHASPDDLVVVGGVLYFSANDGTNGEELWKSDGTAAGTTMVEDSVPGGGLNPSPGAGSDPSDLVNINGTLFFQADDGTNGDELWQSDGTVAGTAMVDDHPVPNGGINPGAGDSFPVEMTELNGSVYFQANDGTNGAELWRSDGTPAGTSMVEDAVPGGGINPGAADSFVYGLTRVGGTLFFAAEDVTNGGEVWKTDGAGATIVEDAVPGGGIRPGAVTDNYPDALTNVNGTLFFQADDGATGAELWKATVEGPATQDPTPVGNTPGKKCAKKKKKKAKKGAAACKKKKKKKKKKR